MALVAFPAGHPAARNPAIASTHHYRQSEETRSFMQRCVQLLALAALAGAQSPDSDNVFGTSLGKCDRPAYFAANPAQRDTKYPVTGYFRNNGAINHSCSLPSPLSWR